MLEQHRLEPEEHLFKENFQLILLQTIEYLTNTYTIHCLFQILFNGFPFMLNIIITPKCINIKGSLITLHSSFE